MNCRYDVFDSRNIDAYRCKRVLYSDGTTRGDIDATTDVPTLPVSAGWSGVGFTGIIGQIQVSNVFLVNGPGYNWSFTLQSDTDQNVQGTQYANGAILYPPGQTAYQSAQVKTPVYGYYINDGNLTKFTFTAPPPGTMGPGWVMTGLPTFQVPLKVTSVLDNVATIIPVDGSPIPVMTVPVYVNGAPAAIQQPNYVSTFTPGRFTSYVSPDVAGKIPNVQVPINANIKVGNYAELRELNTDTSWSQDDPSRLFPANPYIETSDKGFSSGSVLALQAVGPQDEYLMTDDMTRSEWNPEFKRYSNFVMYQKTYPFPPPNPSYQGQVVQIELRPTELGHLISNMYLSVTLPALPAGCSYTPNVGRASLQQVDLLINETTVETLYDDWYIIRDQMFLDADEQLGLQTALNVSNAQVGGTITIPLEFFFCRRHSHYNKGRERLRKPYFPVCAMWNQRLYVRFTFRPSTWWCNAPTASNTDVYPAGTALWPTLVTEEILLENAEAVLPEHTSEVYRQSRPT